MTASWTDEELPEPGGRLPGGRWLLPVAGLAVVVAALVVVVVHAASGGSPAAAGAHASPSPQRTATASASSVPAPVIPGRSTLVVQLPSKVLQPPKCPVADNGELACTTVPSVPAAFTAAVHAVLPGARPSTAVTQLLRPTGPETFAGIWSRRYTARWGVTTIRIVVTRGGDVTDGPSVGWDDGRHETLVVEHSRSPYVVVVDVESPSGKAPSLDRILRLAADPRLTSA